MCLFTEYTMTVIKEMIWKALIANVCSLCKSVCLQHFSINYAKVIVPVLISRLLFDLFNLLKDWSGSTTARLSLALERALKF